MGRNGAGERRDGGRTALLWARLARAILRPGREGTSALRRALRDYVRAARAAGLGAQAVLADVDRAWRRGGATGRGTLTRDVLEVAALLELGAGDEGASRELRRG